jgi:hypothetical protein
MSLIGGLFASKPMFYGHKVPLLQSMIILNGDIILIIQFIPHVYCARTIFALGSLSFSAHRASFLDVSQYLFISQCLCFLLLSSLFCQSYTYLFCGAFCQFVVAIYGHLLCPPLLSTTSVLLWPKQSCRVSRYLGIHCLSFGLQTPYGWCQTILNIFFVKLLLCKPTWIAHRIYLSYHLLWHPIFFGLHHGCRFVCARMKYFLSLTFYPYCVFSAYLKKIEET